MDFHEGGEAEFEGAAVHGSERGGGEEGGDEEDGVGTGAMADGDVFGGEQEVFAEDGEVGVGCFDGDEVGEGALEAGFFGEDAEAAESGGFIAFGEGGGLGDGGDVPGRGAAAFDFGDEAGV